MTKASGRKAHSNGADFEKYLEDVVFKAALDSGYFRRIDKQNPTYVALRSRAGVAFTPKEASGVDWIALGGDSCPWYYIAMEAKHSDTATLAQSRIKPHQAKHLNAVLLSRQVGVLMVQFTHARGRERVCAALDQFAFQKAWQWLFTRNGRLRHPRRDHVISVTCGSYVRLVTARMITADHARIPAAIALQLCAESPEALAVLCRVLWFARGSGECFASCATMRMAGAAMALPVLRRGLVALQDRGLLLAIANPERSCVTYRPTSALAKSPRSVFVPPEVWRGFKPAALAAWVVWRLTGCDAGELPKHLTGRSGKQLSRSQGYALFRTLRSGGVSLEPVRKRVGAESEKDSTNTDDLKTYKKSIDPMYLSNLFALTTCEPSAQLALPIRAPLRVVSPQMPEPMPADWIDWEAVSAHNPGASVAMPAPKVPRQIESVAFYDLPNAWKQLVAAYPPLEPPKVLASPSGLPPSEERKLMSSWLDCAKDWQLSDIPALAEYLHAGQLKHITSNLSNYIVINLDALLQRAEKWRKDGRPVAGASALQPQWDQGDILSQLTRNPAEARR